ncbi:SLATT domain-containing protein [Companilactobacillus nuruki]|uniref:SMODS and SLOG-associating 2TM effector domain-containing protein n=1 Tax=Companilactobacillus nuruki TaxID=1993540 RepID=A0A2N7AWC5_9LACO|nr:SLATT domain-containing protein [Companilactobacillus nuruki]PMD73054.1 hypothetical protein CBP76_02670 [Companilactobacillus nuruki]
MDNYHKKLMNQLRESYGKLTYTYTAHNKMANRMNRKANNIAFSKIILSAISTGGLLGTIFLDKYYLKIITALISTILLIINLYFKESQLSEKILEHRKAADSLWLIREQYISLMTDFEQLSIDTICTQRDHLIDASSKIYNNSPRTDSKSYVATQNALKNDEEQFFTEEEIDKMLPKHLRNTKCN